VRIADRLRKARVISVSVSYSKTGIQRAKTVIEVDRRQLRTGAITPDALRRIGVFSTVPSALSDEDLDQIERLQREYRQLVESSETYINYWTVKAVMES
jgi:hypothetical protein